MIWQTRNCANQTVNEKEMKQSVLQSLTDDDDEER